MKINGASLPDADNRGRVFPFMESGPHFAGPCVVNGVLMVVKLWENQTTEGRKYYRMIFETPEDCPNLIS